MRYSNWIGNLPADALSLYLREHGTPSELKAEEELPIASSCSVCLVESGWLSRVRSLENDREGVTALYLPGDAINLDRMVEPAADDVVRAISAASVLCVRPEALRAAMRSDSDLALAVMRRLIADADWLREAIAALGHLPVQDRLVIFVAQTRRRLIAYGKLSPDAQRFAMPLTQSMLGAVAGATGVHINRVIGALRRDKLVEFAYQRVRIPDLPRFESYSGSLLA